MSNLRMEQSNQQKWLSQQGSDDDWQCLEDKQPWTKQDTDSDGDWQCLKDKQPWTKQDTGSDDDWQLGWVEKQEIWIISNIQADSAVRNIYKNFLLNR